MQDKNNHVMLKGYLTNEPALKKVSENTYKSYFVLAVKRVQSKREEKLNIDYIPVCLWGKKAEESYKKLKKGKMVLIFGKLQIRRLKGDTKKIVSEVIADSFNVLETADNTEIECSTFLN